MPLNKLLSEQDDIQWKSDCCMYADCKQQPIKSHIIPSNYLYKLDADLKKILMLQQSLVAISKEPLQPRLRFLKKDSFSTFIGFCQEHDSKLFKCIDLFNGTGTKEIATLAHFKNICYGITHINSCILQLKHYKSQNYTLQSNAEGQGVYDLLYSNVLSKRLEDCLRLHKKRKILLEMMIRHKDYENIRFFEISGSLNNPVFSGRSTSPLLINDALNYPGYGHFPFFSYLTLLSEEKNLLIFTWLEKDKKHSENLSIQLKKVNALDILALSIYGTSDALAMTQSHYDKHAELIDKMLAIRVY
jgi:hypothetical protein